MPPHHSLYGLRVILIVSVYFYMDMNCFRLARVVSSWLRVGSVAADSFGWLAAVGFGWLRMISGSFGWFRVVFCFSSYALALYLHRSCLLNSYMLLLLNAASYLVISLFSHLIHFSLNQLL